MNRTYYFIEREEERRLTCHSLALSAFAPQTMHADIPPLIKPGPFLNPPQRGAGRGRWPQLGPSHPIKLLAGSLIFPISSSSPRAPLDISSGYAVKRRRRRPPSLGCTHIPKPQADISRGVRAGHAGKNHPRARSLRFPPSTRREGETWLGPGGGGSSAGSPWTRAPRKAAGEVNRGSPGPPPPPKT